MPPWQHIIKQARKCAYCGVKFKTKREAKFCSSLCQSRARPKRPYNPKYRLPYMKQYRIINGDYLRTQEKRRNDEVKRYLREIKLAHGCADCGYATHHAALDFDHLSDKLINVCNASSIKQAKAEIAKCEVVCANCHRIRTYERLHATKPGATYDVV